MRNIVIVIMMLFVSISSLLAQNNAQCQQMFSKYIAGLGEFDAPVDGRNYFMHITTSTIPNKLSRSYTASPYSSENIDVKVVLAKGRMFYYSTYINFYEDSENSFIIIHPQKMIIWKKITPQKQKQTQALQMPMTALRKQIFDELTMMSCVDDVFLGKKVKQITMIAKQKLRDESAIEKIIYWYNPADNKIEKQEIIFIAGQPTIKQEMIYNELDTNYKGNVASSAINNVYDRNKKLLKIYSGYTVDFQ